MMDPRVTSLRPDTTAREALSLIRSRRMKAIHDVFITDVEGPFSGSVGIQDLALARPDARVAELAQPNPPRVQALAPQDEMIAIAEDRRLTSLPVVDISDRLLGVIRYADLLSASQHDATADLQTMVGVSKEERAFSSVSFAVRKRLPWLQVNLAMAFLAASVVGLFEATIARFTAPLAVLLSVVAWQSGNTGAQALAVTMRGLALREIRVRHWLRVGIEGAGGRCSQRRRGGPGDGPRGVPVESVRRNRCGDRCGHGLFHGRRRSGRCLGADDPHPPAAGFPRRRHRSSSRRSPT